MAVSMRRSARRRPYGTIFFLTLLALALAWSLIPYATGKSVPTPLGFLRPVPRATPVEALAPRRALYGANGYVATKVGRRCVPKTHQEPGCFVRHGDVGTRIGDGWSQAHDAVAR